MCFLPIFLIQIWRFVTPGLYQNEKQAFLPFLLATPILFITGAAMVYYIVIPLAWDFFLSFQVNSVDGSLPIELEPRISEYLSLIMKLIFLLDYVLNYQYFIIVSQNRYNHQMIWLVEKVCNLNGFCYCAMLTPPDVISQILLALPIIALYEVSIIFLNF